MRKFLLEKYGNLKRKIFKNINIFENFSLKKVLFFFPFIFGFGQNFYKKYENKSFYFISTNIFFEKKKTEETIGWETFNFFIVKNIDEKNIKNFNVYKNILVLDLKKPLNIEFFGIIKNKNFSNYKIISNKYFIIQSKDIFLESEYIKNIFTHDENILYKNDSIPKKINKISFIKKNFIKEKFFDSLKTQNKIKSKEYEKLSSLYKNKKIILKKFSGKKIFYFFENENDLNTNNFLKNKNKVFEKTVNQYFYLDKIRFYNENLKKIKISYNLKNKFNLIQTLEILKILQDYSKIYKTNKIENRFISGYNFINYNKKKSLYYFLQTMRTKEKLIKTFLPGNFLSLEHLKNFILFNKVITNPDKNGFLGISRENTQIKIFYNSQVFNFQKNLRPQAKKFRKIDDFSTENVFKLVTKSENSLKFYKYKKEKELYINKSGIYFKNSNKFLKKLLLDKIYYTYIIEKKLTFRNSQKQYIENWEFISSKSWLFLTKFSLIIYISYFLNELYKDYGKELINYLIEYGKTSETDFEALKEQYFYNILSFRIIKKTKKKIKDIVGIDFILPEIGEIILILKNAKQTKKIKKPISKGFLISGPPGNGKTLLVQAIAGESKVPVLIQSASLLINNKQQGQSHKKLKKIFHEAKKLGPSIIFIDEIDSLGKKRSNIISNNILNEKQTEIVYSYKSINKQSNTQKPPFNIIENSSNIEESKTILIEKQTSLNEGTALNILTQFLIEMDGIQNQKKFIVFGATNRLKSLDPAFTRPGRFDKIITLEIPSKRKRIRILKFYSKTRKIEKNISWAYLSKKTSGFTASDLASIMNESAIQSILRKTTHTIETIEKGIDYITSYNNTNQNSLNYSKNFSYYEVGKTIGLSFKNLKSTKLLITLNLFNRKKNTRHERIYNDLVSENHTKIELENLLVFLYLGKCSEFIFRKGKKIPDLQNYFNSFFNEEDYKIIEFIGFLMINQWYLYTINILLKKENQTLLKYENQVHQDSNFILNQKIFKLFKLKKIHSLKTLSTYQENGLNINWQSELLNYTGELKKNNTNWYRLYIPNPDEKLSNIEWIPPDLFIHKNLLFKNISNQSNINFNNLYYVERDYLFHSLILNSFNKALFKIEKYREWIDYFATSLLRYGILRENEIKNLLIEKEEKNGYK